MKAWHAMDRFEGRGGCSEKTWLVTIAVNTCRDYRRSAWLRRVTLVRGVEELPPALVPVSSEEKTLFEDIMRLPPRHRQVVLLYYYQDMTMQEIADALRVSPSTVHHRLGRARQMLRDALEGGDGQ